MELNKYSGFYNVSYKESFMYTIHNWMDIKQQKNGNEES